MEEFILRPEILALILLWTLPWKGMALWKSAKNNQLNWFIALLLLNTLAILEIVYLFYFAKQSNSFAKQNKSSTK